MIKGMAIKLALNKIKGDSFGDFEDMAIYAPDDVKKAVDKQVNYQQLVPGFTVMFGFFIIGYVRSAIRAERLGGTLERSLSLPVHRAA